MEELLKLIEGYGLSVVISAIFLYFIIRLGNLYLKKFEKKITSKKKQADLIYHPFFFNIEKILRIDLSNLAISDSFRKILISDLLRIRLEVIKEEYLKLCHEKFSEYSAEAFKSWVLTKLININEKCNQRSFEKGIPKIFIEKFDSLVHPLQTAFYMGVEGICDSALYENNLENFYEILTLKNLINCTMLKLSEKIAKSLNGELIGLEYKGLKCETTMKLKK